MDIEQGINLALSWLKKAYSVTGDGGFSAYYEQKPLLKGKWVASYPETSAYIIPTLLAYADRNQSEDLLILAEKTARWLCQIQMDSGAFTSGLASANVPSVFNTGQIILGLNAAYQHFEEDVFQSTAIKAGDWLLHILDQDGAWRQAAYVSGYIPSYYTRVLWPLAELGIQAEKQSFLDAVDKALPFYLNRIYANLSIKDWGFFPAQTAPTHTIAYTLRGFFELGLLLQRRDLLDYVHNACLKIISLIQKRGRLAGTYDEQWNANYRFQCLTGNCQMSILFAKMATYFPNQNYRFWAEEILRPVFKVQYKGNDENRRGAIAGSTPIWGRYFRFRYPNWAVKFFLDACLLLTDRKQENLST